MAGYPALTTGRGSAIARVKLTRVKGLLAIPTTFEGEHPMATATFGRRNAVQSGPAPRAPAPRRHDAEAPRWTEPDARGSEVEAPAGRAIDAGNTRNIVVGALVLLLLAVVLPMIYVSDLRRDAALQDTFGPDMSVRVERASCSRYFFLVTSCTMQFSWAERGVRKIADTGFLVGFKSMGGLSVVPVRSAADPAVVTAGVALDHLGNRTWTLVLVCGGCLLLGGLMLMKLYRGRV
jgi:hypothetical protein